MKKILTIYITAMIFAVSAHAQEAEQEIKKVIHSLFEGMRNADSNVVRAVFAPNAIMQSVANDRDGKTIIRQDAVANFVSFVGQQKNGDADEQIVIESMKIDGNLAYVWTPYQFFFKGKFSHCGVNAFTLVQLNGSWKINYLIDTRRKENCN